MFHLCMNNCCWFALSHEQFKLILASFRVDHIQIYMFAFFLPPKGSKKNSKKVYFFSLRKIKLSLRDVDDEMPSKKKSQRRTNNKLLMLYPSYGFLLSNANTYIPRGRNFFIVFSTFQIYANENSRWRRLKDWLITIWLQIFHPKKASTKRHGSGL